MWNVSFAWGAAEWGMCHAAREYFSRRCHRSTQKPCGVLVNNTDCAAGAEDRHRYFAGERDVENVECGMWDVRMLDVRC